MSRCLMKIPFLLMAFLFSTAAYALAAEIPANYTVWDRMPAEAAVDAKLKIQNTVTLYTAPNSGKVSGSISPGEIVNRISCVVYTHPNRHAVKVLKATKAYKYRSLVSGFVDHKADVFIVTVEPKPNAHTIYKNTHPGQEFNLVLEGRMEIYLSGKTIVLDEGDSIYFDSSQPHGMLAVGDKAVRFLAFTVE